MATALFLLPFMLSHSTIKAAEPTYPVRGLYCSHSNTFARNGSYLANLKLVLDDLVYHADQETFFAAEGTSSTEAVYGSFMCIGDVSNEECTECVERARREITRVCGMTKVSILWYDQCTLRYSDTDFNKTVEKEPRFYKYDEGNVEEPRKFMELLNNKMDYALRKAATQDPRRRYSYREKNLYTFAQCAPYLPADDCLECLRNATSSLLSLQTGITRGRVLLPSCFVRFEIYSFPRRRVLLPGSSKGNVHLPLIKFAAILTATVGSTLLFYRIVRHLLRGRRRRRVLRRNSESRIEEDWTVRRQISELQSLQFHLQTIEAATNNFSDDNKLGEGGFGPVYKGTLPGGQEIAAKRLSRSSGQGVEEFKTEVELVAKLQHRNLVRLLGFSMERDETILVYENMPNRSLDRLLFDPELSRQLDWSARYKVMVGVARGLLYLHEDSRLRIIHRDLKASNILLDAEMNPKISDFGMARTFGTNQTQGSTNRIAGTYGYMSPEYVMFGHFSVKSDVFSYGVLMLEIITGKKNTQFFSMDSDEGLLDCVWKHWTNRTLSEVVEPALSNAYSMDEVIRCMHISLLCVQDDMEDRPTMDAVILMLNSDSTGFPVPQSPSFYFSRKKYKPAPFVLNSDQSTSKDDQSNGNITPSWFASDSGSADTGSCSQGFEASVSSIRCIGYTI